MRLNEQESRVAVAALQVLERKVAAVIEESAAPHDAMTDRSLSPRLRDALDRHETISNLTKKLATAGVHEMDAIEVNLAIEGLDRYIELLDDADHEGGDADDFLLSPDIKARHHERQSGAMLLEKLTRRS